MKKSGLINETHEKKKRVIIVTVDFTLPVTLTKKLRIDFFKVQSHMELVTLNLPFFVHSSKVVFSLMLTKI